jgi:hypothetical protein
VLFRRYVKKYGRTGQARDDNIIQHMCYACWITAATNTLAEYVVFTAFHSKNGYAKAPQCYVIHTIASLVQVLYQCCTVNQPLLPSGNTHNN